MYEYHKFDPSVKRSLYMYSDVNNKNFLNDFKKSRNLKLKNKNLFLHKSKIEFNLKKFRTYIKIIETKKKIFSSKNKEITIDDYIEISKYIAESLLKKFDLISFNSMLKLNDYIIYLLNLKKKCNKNILIIFKLEFKLILHLSKLMKINEKIKL